MKLLKNKKGGEFKAGVWIVVLAVYFIFFILATTSVGNLFAEEQLNNISINADTFEFSNLLGQNFCDNPRYKYNPQTLEKTEYTKVQYDFLNCDETLGVKSSDICLNINGCVWENVTSGFWWWTTTEDASCIGTINANSYNISTNTEFVGDVVATHDNTALFGVTSVCNHPNVINDKELCNVFGCTWDTLEIEDGYSSSSSVIDTVKDLFSFRYSFGFESDNVNDILNTIFFIIPLLMMIISIYMILPFLH